MSRYLARRMRLGVFLLAASCLLMTACGSSAKTTSSATTAAPGAAAAATASQTGAGSSSLLAQAFKGDVLALPIATVKPPTGARAWIVSCGQQAETCAEGSAAAKAAAQLLGWTATVCDGQLSPTGWGSCIRQGVAAKSNVIITLGIDCPAVQQPIAEAAGKGVTTVNAGGVACPASAGTTYDANLEWAPGASLAQYYAEVGRLAADWVIGETNGQADVLELNFSSTVWGPQISAAFEAELKSCGGCKVAERLDISNQDVINSTLTQKFSTALLQNPSVNAVFVPIDAWLSLGLAQAIKSSAHAASIHVIGALGGAANLALIRGNGGENATVAYSPFHYGYAAIDVAARTLAKQPQVSEGITLQVVDPTHNMPSSGSYVDSPGVAAHYQQIWGLG